MSSLRLTTSLVALTLMLAACRESSLAPEHDVLARTARNPNGSPEKNKSCDSGNGAITRKSGDNNEKNACATVGFTVVAPSGFPHTFSVPMPTASGCVTVPKTIADFNGGTTWLPVCAPWDVVTFITTGYTIPSATGASCVVSNNGTDDVAQCAIITPGTVITIQAI